ncbi:Endonuclease/exonuclease/phosphatase, partial [Absidia repens]
MPFLSHPQLQEGLTNTLSKYGYIYDIGIITDPLSQMFLGSGYAVLDTAASSQSSAFLPLTHTLPWEGLANGFHAVWENMPQYCKYCHQDGHIRDACPTARPLRLCFTCNKPGHVAANCRRSMKSPSSSEPPSLPNTPPKTGNQQTKNTNEKIFPLTNPASINPNPPSPSFDQSHSASPSPISGPTKDIEKNFPMPNPATANHLPPSPHTPMSPPSQPTSESPTSYNNPSTPIDIDSSSTDHDDHSTNSGSFTEDTAFIYDTSFLDDAPHHDTSPNDHPISPVPKYSLAIIIMIINKSTTFRLGSLNCNGLIKINQPQKRSDFIRHLYSLSLSILAIQESHATPSNAILLNRHFPNRQTLWTSSCGLISFSPDYHLTLINFMEDPRILAASVSHPSNMFPPFQILVLYAPASSPTLRRTFFHTLTTALQSPDCPLTLDNLIILGDFNFSLIRPNRTLSGLDDWLSFLSHHCLNCLHIKGENHLLPTFCRPNITPTTIDHIFASHSLASTVIASSVEFLSSTWTDHALLTTTFNIQSRYPIGPGTWRANPLFLHHSLFKSTLDTHLTHLATRL